MLAGNRGVSFALFVCVIDVFGTYFEHIFRLSMGWRRHLGRSYRSSNVFDLEDVEECLVALWPLRAELELVELVSG